MVRPAHRRAVFTLGLRDLPGERASRLSRDGGRAIGVPRIPWTVASLLKRAMPTSNPPSASRIRSTYEFIKSHRDKFSVEVAQRGSALKDLRHCALRLRNVQIRSGVDIV